MKSEWRFTLTVLACTLIIFVAAYWQTAVSIYGQWRTATYSHGILVIPLSFWLAWRKKKSLAQVQPRVSLWVAALLPAPAFVWLLGKLTATSVVQHFCFVAIGAVLIWGILGTRAARMLLAPLVFLFFAVPAGDSLIPWLQDFSAWFAVKLLDLTRVPVLLEGRIITIPSGKWEVAEACSGIHYLLATVTIGFVYAEVTYRKWSRKAAFLAASVIVPVIANGFRVYGILLTDYLGGAKLARGVDHVIAGWFFLSVITILLFAAGWKWKETLPAEEEEGPRRESALEKGKRSAPRTLLFAAIGLLVAGTAPAFARIAERAGQATQPMKQQAAGVLLPWIPTEAKLTGWSLEGLAPDAVIAQSYAKQERTVELHIAYYKSNEKTTKMVSSTNSLYERTLWLRAGEKDTEATIEGKTVRVRQTAIRSADKRLVLWNWYWVAGEFTSNEYRAKWLLAWARLKGDQRGTAEIVLATEEPIAGEPAETLLRDFTEHLSLRECFADSGSAARQ